ncbi:MAG: aminotransferase class V-fold PLP-dependent enzyme [Clostridia bacterium]|nr:aminotransferase class V-fold PLP-dependent enzyme [Clostridia bacterium]
MLENKISKITDGVYPFHMPGHKRQKKWLDGLTDCDITEISGADDLHAPNGIIKDAQIKAAKLFGTVATIFLSGGSTAGVLSAVSSVCDFGSKIIIARNCHKSVYNACKINGLEVTYVYPAVKHRLGVFGEVSPADIDIAMKQSGAKVVVITSPTYEGIVSDIKTIAKTVHKNGGILVVDSAHGAHLGLNDYFPKSARALGADIVIESAHKTLPCLTGAAMLHICSHRVSYMLLREKIATFETSSPSYPIICSIDRAVTKICEKDLFTPYVKRLENFYEKAGNLKHLYLFTSADFDKGKLVICTEKTNISGFELKKLLLENYKIETEMAMPNYTLAMTSIADTDQGFNRLLEALTEIDKTLTTENKGFAYPPPKAETVKNFNGGEMQFLTFKDCKNKVSAEFIYAYPPGSPIIAPGEKISGEILEYLDHLYSSGAQILSSLGNYPEHIAIFKENG